MPWIDATSPLDRGSCLAGCYATDRDEFVGVGQNADATKAIMRSPNAVDWTYETSPFDGRTGQAVVRDLFHGVYVAAGFNADLSEAIATSPDGETWTGHGNPFPGGAAQAVACKQATGKLVVGSGGVTHVIATSSDAATFTAIATILDGYVNIAAINYSPSEDLWMAAGEDNHFAAFAATSSDDGATWALLTHPMDASNAVPPRVYRDEANGKWWLLGQTTGAHALAVSSDSGATWTEVATPLDPVAGSGAAYAMVDAGGVLALGGRDNTQTFQMCFSADGGATWLIDGDPSPLGAGTAYGLVYSSAQGLAAVFGQAA